MNFNFIPTDNLYKFLAISGLFLLVFNYYYSREQIYLLKEEATKLERRLKLITTEYKGMNSASESSAKLGKKISDDLNAARDNRLSLTDSLIYALEDSIRNPSKRNHAKTQLLEDKIALFDNEISILDKKYADWSKQAMNQDQNSNEIDSLVELADFEAKLLDIKTSKYRTYQRALIIGLIMSAIFIVIGFGKWIELQITMDRQLYKFQRPRDRYKPMKRWQKKLKKTRPPKDLLL